MRPLPRARKYSIHLLEIGESMVLPWTSDVRADVIRERVCMVRSIGQEQSRYGKKFTTRARPDGLWVRRLK